MGSRFSRAAIMLLIYFPLKSPIRHTLTTDPHSRTLILLSIAALWKLWKLALPLLPTVPHVVERSLWGDALREPGVVTRFPLTLGHGLQLVVGPVAPRRTAQSSEIGNYLRLKDSLQVADLAFQPRCRR